MATECRDPEDWHAEVLNRCFATKSVFFGVPKLILPIVFTVVLPSRSEICSTITITTVLEVEVKRHTSDSINITAAYGRLYLESLILRVQLSIRALLTTRHTAGP